MTNEGLFGNRVAARANREERTLLDGLGLWGFSLLGFSLGLRGTLGFRVGLRF